MSTPVLLKPKEIKPMKENLNQAEVQQLLHELRDTLSMVTEIKNNYKEESQNLWELSDKTDLSTSDYFEDFSLSFGAYKKHKVRERRLVNLITKLKGLQ